MAGGGGGKADVFVFVLSAFTDLIYLLRDWKPSVNMTKAWPADIDKSAAQL